MMIEPFDVPYRYAVPEWLSKDESEIGISADQTLTDMMVDDLVAINFWKQVDARVHLMTSAYMEKNHKDWKPKIPLRRQPAHLRELYEARARTNEAEVLDLLGKDLYAQAKVAATATD